MRILFLCACCCFVIRSFSQVRLGVQAGYNNSKFLPTITTRENVSSVNGVHAGLLSEIKLNKNIFLQSGLLLTQKGSHLDVMGIDFGFSTDIKLLYLQLPLNVEFKYDISKNFKLMAGAGFFGARGISGTEKGKGFSIGGTYPINRKVKYKNDAVSDNNTIVIKPFDAGYNFLAGIEWKDFQLTGNYSHGFVNVYSISETEFKNQTFNISVSYLFPLKK